MTMRSISRALRAVWRRDDGTAVVELGIMLPVFVLLTLVAINFARLTFVAAGVGHAARAGAQYGAQSPALVTDAAGIQAAAQAEATDIGSLTSVNSAPVCNCDAAATPCTGVTCASGAAPNYYVVVTVTKQITLPLPLVTRTVTLSRTARLRVQ